MNMSQVIPPYDIFTVTIKKSSLITPRLKRITVDARELGGLRPDMPGQYLKVFVRNSDGLRQAGRAYTVRRFDPTTNELELDFVLHGDEGNISKWASGAVAGDVFEVSTPKQRSGISIDPERKDYLFFADETGLPAVSAILEALPRTTEARVFIEVEDSREIQLVESAATSSIRWLYRKAGETLVDAAMDIVIPPRSLIWATAESNQVSRIRAELKKHALIQTCRIYASGYWKKGEADHRDPD